MKKLLLIILLVSCFGQPQLYAQKKGQERIDSLQTALSKSGQDTNRVKVLNGLSSYAGWRVGNYDTANYFAQKALGLARKLDFKKGEGVAYNNIGTVYFYQANYSEALKNYQAALKIFKAIGDKKGIAYCYNGIGAVYSDQGNYPEALKNYQAVLKIYESIGSKAGIAGCYMDIGSIYSNQGNYPEALSNYQKGLKIAESIGGKRGMTYCYAGIGGIYQRQGNYPKALSNYQKGLKIAKSIKNKRGIAGCYMDIGSIYSHQGNYPKALKNQTMALEISKSIKSKGQMIYCYGNIGATYQLQGNYPKALKNFTAALNISESIGAKNTVAGCYINIGEVYVRLKKAKEGKVWLQKGLALSKEIGAKNDIKGGYENLAEADSALGNFKASFENYKMYIVYRDSIYNKANTKKLTQTAMQYQFDKKQLADSLKNVQVKKLAAEKLSKQKTYTAMGGGLAVLLLVFSGLIFRNNKKLDKEKKKSEDLLLNILPSEVADELKEKGNAEAKQFDEVTVLFTDFVNFTQTAENLNPKELVQELNECFTAFDDIMERNGLEKIKTVGDAYLAVCGLPAADSKHAHKVVQAALDIRNFIEDRKQHEKSFDIRIGIHSGSVVAGIVGVKKFAYDIWGDTVNTAARMEENSEAGKINISEITYQLVKADFECTYRGEVDAKNKGKMKMYFVNKAGG